MNVKQEAVSKKTYMSGGACTCTVTYSTICPRFACKKHQQFSLHVCTKVLKHSVAEKKHARSANTYLDNYKSPISDTSCSLWRHLARKTHKSRREEVFIQDTLQSFPKWPAKMCPPVAWLLFRRFAQLILCHYIFLLLRALGSALKKRRCSDSC